MEGRTSAPRTIGTDAKKRDNERGIRQIIAFFYTAKDGIRGRVRSRGLGDVYKTQVVEIENVSQQKRELPVVA
ncbi:hypothetical protein GF581_11840 [Staphylococcus aureus]|uniref:hypothetical protein n=1 Tax=Staphylococcus aureus TaxID=1280 RepID=UPI0012AFE3FC|nr:hypothetical protein [Staphylococcus aureus]MRV18803.1 hypothetical protein [Staphylococcus aureus]